MSRRRKREREPGPRRVAARVRTRLSIHDGKRPELLLFALGENGLSRSSERLQVRWQSGEVGRATAARPATATAMKDPTERAQQAREGRDAFVRRPSCPATNAAPVIFRAASATVRL